MNIPPHHQYKGSIPSEYANQTRVFSFSILYVFSHKKAMRELCEKSIINDFGKKIFKESLIK